MEYSNKGCSDLQSAAVELVCSDALKQLPRITLYTNTLLENKNLKNRSVNEVVTDPSSAVSQFRGFIR